MGGIGGRDHEQRLCPSKSTSLYLKSDLKQNRFKVWLKR
jgi:hypothetical protein